MKRGKFSISSFSSIFSLLFSRGEDKVKIPNGKAEDDNFRDFPASDKTVAGKFVVLLDLLAKKAASQPSPGQAQKPKRPFSRPNKGRKREADHKRMTQFLIFSVFLSRPAFKQSLDFILIPFISRSYLSECWSLACSPACWHPFRPCGQNMSSGNGQSYDKKYIRILPTASIPFPLSLSS